MSAIPPETPATPTPPGPPEPYRPGGTASARVTHPIRRIARRAAVVLTYTAAAAGLLFTFIRLFGLEFTWPLRTLISYTPYLLIPALLAPVAALLLRRRALALAALLAPLVLALLIAPRFAANGQPDASGPTVRFASSNLFFGEGDAATLVRLIDAHAVDVLSLQELTAQAVANLEAAGISQRLPYHEVTAVDGAEGTGVYSRYPLTRNHSLEYAATFQMTGVTIAIPGARPVELLAAHPAAPWAPSQVDFWLGDLEKLPAATPGGAVRILAGDFNATLDHAALREVLDRGYVDAAESVGEGLSGTWQPEADSRLSLFGVAPPRVTLDHVLVDERVAVENVVVGDLPGADHNPVVATVTLPAE